MTKFLKILLGMLFIMQLLVSVGFELAHDEAYYWLYAKHLDWGYFDHPPAVAVVIKAFSFLPHSEGSVRFGFILLQFLSLFILLRLLKQQDWIKGTILFFTFPLASYAGLFALPDMPLVFMSALYCLGLKHFLEKDSYQSAAVLGLIIALMLNSKYHGILLVFFTILALPRLFLNKKFYLVAGISILLFLPHLWWQYQHDFSTLRYHFLERPSSSFSIPRSFEYLGIQLLLAGAFAGPVVWWIAAKTKAHTSFERSLKFIVVGTIVFFLISSFSKKIEANWTIFLVIPLVVLTASSDLWSRTWVKGLLYTSFALVILARLVLILPPQTLGLKRVKEFNGWRSWAVSIKQQCPGGIMANTYQIASKLSFYLEREIPSLNYHSRRNQFDYWRFDRKQNMDNLCYLTDNSDFIGREVETPEGKKLLLVSNVSYEELMQLKQAEQR